MTTPNPAMIAIARESRGYTQTSLAEAIGVTQGALSKVENSQTIASDDLIKRVSSTLQYPTSFFFQEHRLLNLPLTFFRKRVSVAQWIVKAIRARMNVRRLEIDKLTRAAELPDNKVPIIRAKDYRGDIEHIAKDLRLGWHVPPGPIENLTRLLEDAGILIVDCEFETRQVDGISVFEMTEDLPPIILLNKEMPPDRCRYTLAHELAHVLLHHHLPFPTGDADVEDEANRFANEFLMPAADIKRDLLRLSLKALASLKPYWKVSMGALIKRAEELGTITERQARRFWMFMNKYGYRTHEPVSIPPETPTLVLELVNFHLGALGYTENDLASVLNLTLPEFRSVYLGSGGQGLRAVK